MAEMIPAVIREEPVPIAHLNPACEFIPVTSGIAPMLWSMDRWTVVAAT